MDPETSENSPLKQKRYFFSPRLVFLLSLLVILLIVIYFIPTCSLISKPPSLSNPKSAYELYRYAKTLDDRRQFGRAEKFLKKALELEPNFYKALMELALVYSEEGDIIKSIPLFQKAVTYAQNDKPNYEIAVYNLGKMYLYEGKAEEAWKYLTQAYQMKRTLGERQWPDDRSDPVYYVMTSDKEKFVEGVKKFVPMQIHERTERIHRTARFRPRAALQDCERYLIDNPDSRFTTDILTNKAWILDRLKKYDKAITILEFLKNVSLRDEQKEWLGYTLYHEYFNLKKYDNALAALKDLKNAYPEKYSLWWYKYQQSLVYRKQKDYEKEKSVLQEITGDADKLSYLEYPPKERRGYIALARRRLLEISVVQRDYRSGFFQMTLMYKSGRIVMSLLFSVLFVGFCVFLFFAFSRMFFRGKIDEVLKGKFRLRHLWLVWVIIMFLPLIVQFFLFAANYLLDNLMGRLRLDPYLLSIILGELFIVGLCVVLLKDKYQFDKETLGFILPSGWHIIGIPLAAVVIFCLFGWAYKYVVEEILFFSFPEHPYKELFEQFVSQRGFSQNSLLLFSMVITAPIAEEVLFRVFLFIFLKQFTGNRPAVIISALIFAFIHNTFLLIPYYFVLAVLLNVIYLRTKSIFPSIISHSLMNLSAFFFTCLKIS